MIELDMPQKAGRSKLEIIKEIKAFLETKEQVYISHFKEIGLSKQSALEYIEIINYIHKEQFHVRITELDTTGDRKNIIVKLITQ